jgi:hypothetical protein
VENGGAKFQDTVMHDKATPAHFTADGGHSWTLRYLTGLSQSALVSARAHPRATARCAAVLCHQHLWCRCGACACGARSGHYRCGRTPLAIAQNRGDAEIIDSRNQSTNTFGVSHLRVNLGINRNDLKISGSL